MKRLIVLAILAVALFAAVPSQAECASFGSIYGCYDTGQDHICSYSGLAVTNHYSCIYAHNLQFDYFWFDVYGQAHSLQVDAYPHGANLGVHAASAGLCTYVADSPNYFGIGGC
jgi:hypothetical protein